MLTVSFSLWLIAILPIITLLVLLLVMRVPLVKASVIATILAFFTSLFFFQAPLELLNGEIAKGIWSSLSIIIVIFSALFMYEISCNIQAFKTIKCELTRLIPDKLLQVLVIGWCFTAFLQGPSGFGVPIAVVAPLLIGIGVRPLWAIIIPLIAQSWGSTFGTLALAWEALVEQTTLATQIGSPLYFGTAGWSALLIGLLCFSSGWVICWFYGSWAAIRHGALAVFILGITQAVGQVLLSQITPTLCAFIPSTLALILGFFIAKLPQYSGKKHIVTQLFEDNVHTNEDCDECFAYQDKVKNKKNMASNETAICSSFLDAALPYFLLVAISLTILLTPCFYEYLHSFQIAFSFPRTKTGYDIIIEGVENYSPIMIFVHSGFFIFMASFLSFLFYLKKSLIKTEDISKILNNTVTRAIPASLAVMFLVILSKIMNGSGEIYVLAQGTANITGSFYSFFSPFIGGIGAFMSGSNVSSNILFAKLQQSIAHILNLNDAVILAAQTSGGAIGALIDPAKILLGATAVNMSGCEGDVLRKLAPYFFCMIFITGLIVLCFA